MYIQGGHWIHGRKGGRGRDVCIYLLCIYTYMCVYTCIYAYLYIIITCIDTYTCMCTRMRIHIRYIQTTRPTATHCNTHCNTHTNRLLTSPEHAKTHCNTHIHIRYIPTTFPLPPFLPRIQCPPCIYICTCIYAHVKKYEHVGGYRQTYIHMYVYVPSHVRVYSHIHIYTHICTYREDIAYMVGKAVEDETFADERSREMFEDDMREKLVKELLRCVIECVVYFFIFLLWMKDRGTCWRMTCARSVSRNCWGVWFYSLNFFFLNFFGEWKIVGYVWSDLREKSLKELLRCVIL